MLMSTEMIAFVPYANEKGVSLVGVFFGGFVGLEYSREFLFPLAFRFIQTFAQVVKDCVVADFCMSID